MTMLTPNELEKKIEQLREELIYHGLNSGFGHEKTITLSQKLDSYIVKYQLLINGLI